MNSEEVKEYIKCAQDPVYFLNNYGYVFDITKNTIDRLNLFEYQEDILKKYENHKNNIVE